MSDVDDRWYRTVKHPDGTKTREQTSRHGVGRRWVARWRDQENQQRKRSFEKKIDAERFLAGVQSDLARGTYIDPSAGKVTFRSVAEQWLRDQTFDVSTHEIVERLFRLHAYPALGERELRILAARPSVVQTWIRDLSTGGLSPKSVRMALSYVSAVFSAAVDDRLIVRNPCSAKSVKAPTANRRKVVPWTNERAQAVIAALPGRYRGTGVLAGGCGLRQGEVFGLAVDDVDFLGRVVHVRRQVRIVRNTLVFAPPKGGKERTVPLPDSVGMETSAHIAAYPPVQVTLPWVEPGGRPVTATLLFTTPAGEALNRNRFNRAVWKVALAEAGVIPEREKGAHDYADSREDGMHALRHFYASVLLDAGESIKALSEYLGHHDPGFTLRTYCHLMPASEERTRKAVDAALTDSSAPDVTHGSV